MVKVIFSSVMVLCLLTACNGDNAPLKNPHFFDKSWLTPGKDWRLETRQSLWPERVLQWSDYLIAENNLKSLSTGESKACLTNGNLTLLSNDEGEAGSYRIDFQQCEIPAGSESLSNVIAHGVLSRTVAKLDQHQIQSLYGFDHLVLILPSLTKEKTKQNYIVNTPTPFEKIENTDDRWPHVTHNGAMNISRGGESFLVKISNSFTKFKPREYGYKICQLTDTSIDEVSINSERRGTITFSQKQMHVSGEGAPMCFFPGYQFESSSDAAVFHQDYIPSPRGLTPRANAIQQLYDSDSEYVFQHSDGSRMRLNYENETVTIAVDEDGNGEYERTKRLNKALYLKQTRDYKNLERIKRRF